jgi:O-antigen/teichoic acid export membrane protein
MRIRRLLSSLDHGPLRALGRRGRVLLAGEVVAGAVAVVLALVLARGLGATGYGEYALIVTSVYLISQVIDLRVWEAATKYGTVHLVAGRDVKARAVLELASLVNLAAGLTAAALLILCSGLIADLFVDDPGLAGTIAIYAMVAPLTALQAASRAVLRVFDRLAPLATITALAPVGRLAAAAIALASGGGVHEVLIGLLAAEALATLAYLAAQRRAIVAHLPTGLRFGARVGELRGELREMGRFLAASNASGTLSLLSTRVDVLAVGLFATPAEAGALKIARTFIEPMRLLWAPFYQAIYPELVRSEAAGRPDQIADLARKTTAAAALLLTPIAIGIAATAPLTIPLLAGPGFGEAPLILLPLAAGALLNAIFFWQYPAALALDMRMTALWTLAAATAMQIVLLVALVPTLGAVGAGLAYLGFAVAWVALLLPRVARRLEPEPVPHTGSRRSRSSN